MSVDFSVMLNGQVKTACYGSIRKVNNLRDSQATYSLAASGHVLGAADQAFCIIQHKLESFSILCWPACSAVSRMLM